jgi:hypothetical protein
LKSGQLPAVAENDFLHPIDAILGGLNAGGHKMLNALIYQYIYKFCGGCSWQVRRGYDVPDGSAGY